jgi:hypothetical protein
MGKTKGLEIPQDPSDHSGDIPSLVTVDGTTDFHRFDVDFVRAIRLTCST